MYLMCDISSSHHVRSSQYDETDDKHGGCQQIGNITLRHLQKVITLIFAQYICDFFPGYWFVEAECEVIPLDHERLAWQFSWLNCKAATVGASGVLVSTSFSDDAVCVGKKKQNY